LGRGEVIVRYKGVGFAGRIAGAPRAGGVFKRVRRREGGAPGGGGGRRRASRIAVLLKGCEARALRLKELLLGMQK
jgi:hypothetical protein